MIATTHPIKQVINSQYRFLSSMLDRFPSLLEEWIVKQKEEVKLLANIIVNGDGEVYLSIYSTEFSRVNLNYDDIKRTYIINAEYKLIPKLADICGFKTEMNMNKDGLFILVKSIKSNQNEL